MAYAPPPAEEYSESDDDEFGLGPPTQNTNSLPQRQTISSRGSNGGFNWGNSSETVPKKRTSPKSKIPVVSPTNNGVNIEDFRLSIIRGSVESAAKYIQQGVDVNVTFKTGWTPLMYASHQVNQSLMTLLLNNGATPNIGSTTSLMSCCTSNVLNRETDLESCVKALVSHGADVNATDKYSMNALMMACKKGHAGAVKALIESGADINQREARGFSPLCWACTSGNLKCIKTLVEHGADISVETVDGQTPFRLAASASNFTQISAYFSTLPGFRQDEQEEHLVPLPTNLSNGATVSNDPQSDAASPPKPDTTTDEHLDKTVYHKFGEVELFLFGLELSSLVPKFQSHDVTLQHLLNITDDELIKIGVQSVGHRKKILDSVHELHKKEWQPSSIPAYEKVKAGKQLSCAEVTTIIANGATHSACLSATLRYVTAQVARNPALLQVDKHGRGIHALRRFLHEMIGNSETQLAATTALRTEIEKTLASGEAETADNITKETTAKSGNRLVIYSSALVTFGFISLGVYVLSKKFPHMRIPGFGR